MNATQSRSGGFRNAGLTLAFLALWLKLIVPAGFMPTGGQDGLGFTICSSSLVAAPDGTDPDDGAAKTAGDCVFSLLHAAAVTADPAPAGTGEGIALSLDRPAAPRSQLLGGRPHAAPPPAQGPPSRDL